MTEIRLKKINQRTQMRNKGVRFFLLTVTTVVIVAATGCSNKNKATEVEDAFITPGGVQNSLSTPTPTPVAMTPAPGITVTVAPEITEAPIETMPPIILLSEAEAKKLVLAQLDTNKYSVSLSDDHLNVDTDTYYVYVVFEKDKALEPAIIVSQRTGSLYYYGAEGNVTPFSKFPVDKVEIVDNNATVITEGQALEILKELSSDKLGLSKTLADYTIEVDTWTTIVNGNVSYCFNVFEDSKKEQLVAIFYVSTNGENVYRFEDENGEFMKIN